MMIHIIDEEDDFLKNLRKILPANMCLLSVKNHHRP